MSIGNFARQAIINNPSAKNQELLEMVKAQFPEAKTTIACIAWYKSDIKKNGVKFIATVKRTSDHIKAEIEELNAELLVKLDEEVEDAKREEVDIEAQILELQEKLAAVQALNETQQ